MLTTSQVLKSASWYTTEEAFKKWNPQAYAMAQRYFGDVSLCINGTPSLFIKALSWIHNNLKP